MKAYAVTLGVFAALVVAQDLGSLPDCARTCADNMRAATKAPELECDAGDYGCLCQNPSFTYGFRDCAAAVCDGSSDANSAVEYAVALCANNGVVVTAGPSGSDVNNPTVTGSQSTIFTTLTSDGSTITSPISTTVLGGGSEDSTGSDASSTSGSVVVVTTTISSDGTEIVSTLSSTVAAESTGVVGILTTITSDGSAIVSTISGSLADESTRLVGVVTTITSDGSAIVSTLSTVLSGPLATASSAVDSLSSALGSLTSAIGSATETGDSTATESGADATTTEDDSGAMPTAFPGVLAAVGLVALML